MSAESSATTDTHAAPESPARRLLPMVLPAIVVGAGSSIALIVVTVVANALEGWIWRRGPRSPSRGRSGRCSGRPSRRLSP